MTTTRFYGKSISSSQKTGVTVLRDDSGQIQVSHDGSTPGKSQALERVGIDSGKTTRKGSPFSSRSFCGSNPTSQGTSTVGRIDQVRTGIVGNLRNVKSSSSKEEDAVCADLGLIVASKSGYSLIVLDSDYRDGASIQWLGDNPTHLCILLNIGIVERYSDDGFTSGLPSRWAFRENERRFHMPTIYDDQASSPFMPSVKYDEIDSPYVDTVRLTHYGYWIQIPDQRGGHWSVARTGGAVIALTHWNFSLNAALVCNYPIDWLDWFDSIGEDCYAFGAVPKVRHILLDQTVNCDESLAHGDIPVRTWETVNVHRSCELEIFAHLEDAANQSLAQTYAQHMADNTFLDHISPIDGSTLEERAADAGLDYTEIAEVLALVDDPGDVDPDTNEDLVVEAVWSSWTSSESDYGKLISSIYYRSGFAAVKSSVDGRWYACGILRTIESDENPFDSTSVVLPAAPAILEGFFEDNPGFSLFGQGTHYHAFTTIPREDLYFSALTKQYSSIEWLFGQDLEGNRVQDRIKDNSDYPVYSSTPIVDPGDWALPAIGAKVSEYPASLLHLGGRIRQSVNDPPNSHFIQYDGKDGDSVFVELESDRVYPDDTPDTHPGEYDEDTNPGGIVYRTQTGLADGEVEPTPTPTPLQVVGNTTLKFGSIEIDDAQRLYNHGPFHNPFQTIMVGSVFHANSGYSVFTYTVNKTLENSFYTWEAEDPENPGPDVDCYERYYWIKTELWAAVTNPAGSVIARWQLKGVPPEFEDERPVGSPETEVVVQPPTPQQTFQVNFQGQIEVGTAAVNAKINGYNFILEDDGDGGFTEEPGQIPGIPGTLVSVATVDYDSGSIEITFSSTAPDVGSNVIFYADVYHMDDWYLPFAYYNEVVFYSDLRGFINGHGLGSDGMIPLSPCATITEDGQYVVFSVKTINIVTTERSIRIKKGEFPDADLLGSTQINTTGTDKTTQMIVYDLSSIAGGEPREASFPIFLTQEKITETVVLN